MATVRREVSDRTVVGKIFKYLFIAFNILMAFALVKGCSAAADGMQHTASDAETAGARSVQLSSWDVAVPLGCWRCDPRIVCALHAAEEDHRGRRVGSPSSR